MSELEGADEASEEPEELEVDSIINLAVARVQCIECGGPIEHRFRREGDPDPDDVPCGETECTTCTATNGKRTVTPFVFASGEQAVAVEAALELVDQLRQAGVELEVSADGVLELVQIVDANEDPAAVE